MAGCREAAVGSPARGNAVDNANVPEFCSVDARLMLQSQDSLPEIKAQ